MDCSWLPARTFFCHRAINTNTLKTKINLHYRDYVRTSRRVQYASVIKNNYLALCRENADVYCKNNVKYINILDAKNKECLTLNLAVCLLTTWLRRVKNDSNLNLK
jgi:hypothetical protein